MKRLVWIVLALMLISATNWHWFLPTVKANVFSNTGHSPAQETFENPAIRSVGRLVRRHVNDTECSATLVAPDVIVTAAHCVTDKDGELLNIDYDFYTGATSIQAGTKVQLLYGQTVAMTRDFIGKPGLDIAFLRLKKSLPASEFPPAGVSSIMAEATGPETATFPLLLTGYYRHSEPSNSPPTTEHCHATGYFSESREIAHDCSTTIRMSGSPLYIYKAGVLTILAIHCGSRIAATTDVMRFSPGTANVAAGGQMVALGLARYQAGTLVPDAP